MRYKIFKDGVEVNTIVAGSAFVTAYCEKHGYTYEQLADPEPVTEPECTDTDVINALLGVV